MSVTAHLKVYQIRQAVSIDQIEEKLISHDRYSTMDIKTLIQEKNGINLIGYYQLNRMLPDWVSFISPYVNNTKDFENVKRLSMVLLFEYLTADSTKSTFAVTGGSGAIHLANFIDNSFGISLLERIFDPEENKLNSVREKNIIGDVLASSRYYRRSRALAYEDDFGKCFQNISIRLTKGQIEKSFPAIAGIKANKDSYSVAVNCSSSLDLCVKLDLLSLIKTIKDVEIILASPSKMVFNKSLQPIDKRIGKELIKRLNDSLISSVILFASGRTTELDIDFCPRDFEDYFTSSRMRFSLPSISPLLGKDNKYNQIEKTDFLYSDTKSMLKESYSRLINSKEYSLSEEKEDFSRGFFNSITISTFDADDKPTTSGRLIEYCNSELMLDRQSYFLLDNVWYELKSKFDDDLTQKYEEKVVPNVYDFDFIYKWDVNTEDEYNSKYNKLSNPFELHKIKVNNIEICDGLFVDQKNRSIYILHAKDKIGASIRDLVSQAFISARIIEEEVRTENKIELKKLYSAGIGAGKIDGNEISEKDFLSFFLYKRTYCLLIHAGDNSNMLRSGSFKSRIAKFSLAEFATVMHSSEFKFSFISV